MTKKNMSSNSKSRRKFFKAAAATVVGGSLLAACDSGNKKTEAAWTEGAPEAKPPKSDSPYDQAIDEAEERTPHDVSGAGS